jgi:hypothetical protein
MRRGTGEGANGEKWKNGKDNKKGKAKGADMTYLVMDKFLKDLMSDDGEREARENIPNMMTIAPANAYSRPS